MSGYDLSALPDQPKQYNLSSLPDQPQSAQLPVDQMIPDFGEQSGYTPAPFKEPPAAPNLLRENAPRIQQDVWNSQALPMAGPLREQALRPDLTYASGITENLEAGLRIGFNHEVSNLVSHISQLPGSPEEQGLGVTPLEPPNREEIFKSTFNAMNRALQVDKLAPPKDFADALARGVGESGAPLAETMALSHLTGGLLSPLTAGIASRVPYLYNWLFPIARDAITFGAQSALEPGATAKGIELGAGTGAIIGMLGPYGRLTRAIGGTALGAGQEYETNPQAQLMDYARNAALMGAFAAIGGAHGITADEAAAGTILDWAKGKGYSDEVLARAIKSQGLAPLANEFAEDVTQQARAIASITNKPSRFKSVTPEEFIAQRDKNTRSQFLTPYSAEEMAEWKTWMTEDGAAGYAIKPDGELVNVFRVSERSGAGAQAVIDAIQNGATNLDCFDGHLVRYYKQFGFIENSREPWYDQNAPKGWDI